MKFFLISAHDMTIQNALPHFLSNLCYEKFLNDPKFWDADYDPEVDCRPSPPLASKLVYELVEIKATLSLTVRVRYNDEYLNYCGLEENTDGKWGCDVTAFSAKIDSITLPDTWEAVCLGNRDDYYFLKVLDQAHKWIIISEIVFLRYEECFVTLGVILLAFFLQKLFCYVFLCGCLRKDERDSRDRHRSRHEEADTGEESPVNVGASHHSVKTEEFEGKKNSKKSKKDKKTDEGQDPLKKYKKNSET